MIIEEKTAIHDFTSTFSYHYEQFAKKGFQVGKNGKKYKKIDKNSTKEEILDGFHRFKLNLKKSKKIENKDLKIIEKYNEKSIRFLARFFTDTKIKNIIIETI